nr:T9SS type A sorting domain-containing protein [Bacteroidota bacterium]
TPNLIVNPNFNGGNAGFITQYGNPFVGNPQCTPNVRDFNVNASPTPCIFGWGGPGIGAFPFWFFWANGNGLPAPAVPNPFAWRENIAVLPNTTYQFTGRFANIIRDGIARPLPNMQVTINGIPQGPNMLLNPSPIPFTPITWNTKMFTWCSGTVTTAQIDITSLAYSAAGNDFGIDEISFVAAPSPTTTVVQTTSCSCDPNDKVVTPQGCGPNGSISKGQELTYTIRFQNLGTGPATNVLLSDKLDSDLDIGTLKILAASHNITNAQIIPNNNLIIKFDNINLPDATSNPQGSNGFVIISISPKSGLPDGTVVTNQTGIYFDQNEVVLTQVTKNTFYDNPLPDANFTYKHNCNQTGFVYDFTYSGITPDNATYSWQFEDGTPLTSTQQNPTGIVFANNTDYKNVKLIINRNGCSAEANDTLQVISGLTDNGNKVTVCHNGNLITVSTNALPSHLAHGDCIGQCAQNQNQGGKMINNNLPSQDEVVADLFEFDVMPNPSNNDCLIKLSGVQNNKGDMKIEVSNYLGQLIAELYNGVPNGNNLEVRYDTKTLSSGIYFIKTYYGGQIAFKKLVVEH